MYFERRIRFMFQVLLLPPIHLVFSARTPFKHRSNLHSLPGHNWLSYRVPSPASARAVAAAAAAEPARGTGGTAEGDVGPSRSRPTDAAEGATEPEPEMPLAEEMAELALGALTWLPTPALLGTALCVCP